MWLAVVAAFALDVQQGHVIRLEVKSFTPGMTVVMDDRSIPVFSRNGAGLALVPVAVTATPGTHTLEIRDAAGKAVEERKYQVLDAQYPTQNIVATRAMKALRPLPGEVESMRALYARKTPEAAWAEPFAPPVPQCANSSFGVQRLHNGKPTGNYHRGLDLRSPAGTPVKATAAGKVVVARMWRMHGGTIGIDHGQGITSHYLHLSRLAVREGTVVKRGQLVGYVGATGFATGPHLHWGLYIHGIPTDPRAWAPGITSCQPR